MVLHAEKSYLETYCYLLIVIFYVCGECFDADNGIVLCSGHFEVFEDWLAHFDVAVVEPECANSETFAVDNVA